MIDVKKIAMDMFGPIEWAAQDRGFIKCPGFSLHTGKNGKKDCRIITSGAPTVFCLHASCLGMVDDANLRFRRACGSGEKVEGRTFSLEEKQKIRESYVQKKIEFDLQSTAILSRQKILSSFAWSPGDMWEESPVRLTEDPTNDWNLFLDLFDKEDVLWNGQVVESGRLENLCNFRTVAEWRDIVPCGNFTCPSTFKKDSYSRSNENVDKRKFLVIESDTLSQEDICAVFNFCRQFMKLKAVIYTGGKSLHGWMEFPSQLVFNILKMILPQIGCDPALFKSSQPVRMPGIMRGDKIQSLLYLNL